MLAHSLFYFVSKSKDRLRDRYTEGVSNRKFSIPNIIETKKK